MSPALTEDRLLQTYQKMLSTSEKLLQSTLHQYPMYFNKLNIVTFYCESRYSAKPGYKGETRLRTFKPEYIIEFSSI